jgi:uncharacterized membrane protein (UPF0127 family)
MRNRFAKEKVPVVVVTRDDGAVVCERCTIATTPVRRMRGLLGRSGLAPGDGLLIRPAGSIHTFFMRFPIDAVFLDRDLGVRKVAAAVKPWRLVFARRAHSVLELPAGEADRRGLAAGQRLVLQD